MKTIPYASTRPALYTPGLATDFFEWEVELGEAGLCAEMARLAYVKEADRLQAYLGRAGFRCVSSFGAARGAQGFLAEGPASVVLAFRGTEADDPADLVADGQLLKTPWPRPGDEALVHKGFADQLSKCWGAIGPHLSGIGKRLLFTGHSLGAALATLAASLAARTPALRAPDYLATFGCPRVGDAAFARSLEGIPHDRFVSCCDLVTRVPPEALGYVHTGTLHYIDREGRLSSSPAGSAVDADRRAAFVEYLPTAILIGRVALRELADHAPLNYLSGVVGNRSR